MVPIFSLWPLVIHYYTMISHRAWKYHTPPSSVLSFAKCSALSAVMLLLRLDRCPTHGGFLSGAVCAEQYSFPFRINNALHFALIVWKSMMCNKSHRCCVESAAFGFLSELCSRNDWLGSCTYACACRHGVLDTGILQKQYDTTWARSDSSKEPWCEYPLPVSAWDQFDPIYISLSRIS